MLDFSAVPFLDSTAANTVAAAAAKAGRRGLRFYITGAAPAVRRALQTHGAKEPLVEYRRRIADAVAEVDGEPGRAT